MIDVEIVKQWYQDGKPFAWSEPPTWESQPKFEIAVQMIERWRASRNGQKFTILDCGCFTGYFLRHLIHRGPYAGIGVDVHKDVMERLDAQAKAMEWPLTFTFGAMETATGDPVNIVTAFDVLEHVLDLPKAIETTWARLAPGGLYLAHVPVEPEPTSEHLRVFTTETLKALWLVEAEVSECRDEHGRGTLFACVRKP